MRRGEKTESETVDEPMATHGYPWLPWQHQLHPHVDIAIFADTNVDTFVAHR